MVTKDQIVKDLISLGIKKGDILNVKASLKSIGRIDGGAKTLLDSLIEVVGSEGTIVTEAFVKMYPIQLLKKKDKYISRVDAISYAGALSNEMLLHPESFVSLHPVHRFAGIGGKAEYLMENYSKPDSIPYEVLSEMIKMKAKNLRIGPKEKVVGVGTTHVAIDFLKIQQKRLPYGIYYYDKNQLQVFKANWPSGCSGSFNSLFPFYEKGGAILKRGMIGGAESLLTDMKKTFEVEADLFKKDLGYTICNDPGCAKCRIGWKHSNGKFFSTLFYNVKKGNLKKIIQTISYYFNNNYVPKLK